MSINAGENYKKIIDKVYSTTYDTFMEFIRYLFRYSKDGAVHIIHEHINPDKLDRIMNKNVKDLTDDEKMDLLIHWAYEHGGEDKYKETPFSIIQNITDAELVYEFNRRAKSLGSSVAIKAEAVIVSKE